MRSNKSVTILDMYKEYHKQHKDVEYPQFKQILSEFNDILKDSLLNKSEGFKLPCGLGYVQIVKYRPKSYSAKSLSVDYKSSKEEGKTIYHLNEHSDGFKYRLFWSRVPMTFASRYKYQLQLVRANKRQLAQLIFNKHDYIHIDDIQIYKM